MDYGCLVLDLPMPVVLLEIPLTVALGVYLDRMNARDTAELRSSRIRNEPRRLRKNSL